jgi:hypothetical protein
VSEGGGTRQHRRQIAPQALRRRDRGVGIDGDVGNVKNNRPELMERVGLF